MAMIDSSEEILSEPIAFETKPVPDCIRFFRHGLKNQLLVAAVSPTDEFPAGLAFGDIQEWIHQQGCEGWLLFEDAIAQLSREIKRLEHQKEYIIAEQKDCSVEVIVAPDRLSAWIRIAPAHGGAPLSEELFNRCLEEKNVRFGIDSGMVQKILQEGWCEKELIATGVPPIPGENAGFEQLVQESDHKGAPQERADGSVDYKDLGLWISVSKGTPLLKRIPPTPGTPGTGVDAKPIMPIPGIDRYLAPGVGAATSKEDSNILVATRVGRPFFLENSVQVDPTLEVDAVDPSTGNVIFEGNILIRGSVEAGYTVSAGQDLTVLDTVEGANLKSGRNMTLLTGVYGRNSSEIKVQGNLEARFLNDCRIECGGNIEVTDLISYCNVECDGALFLGKCGGKGQIYGGRIRALKEIQAQILGSVSETATLVEVAPSRALILERDKTQKEIDAIQNDLAIVGKNIRTLKSNSEGVDSAQINHLAGKAAALAEKFEEQKKLLEEIQRKIDISEKGKIRAAHVHRGVALRVGSLKEIISEDREDLHLQPALQKKKT